MGYVWQYDDGGDAVFDTSHSVTKQYGGAGRLRLETHQLPEFDDDIMIADYT